MQNNNGFADALERLRTIMNVDKEVTLDALEAAANYFVQKLRPKIPISERNKKHMKDVLKIVVKGDMVQVIFEGNSYWYLVEHGHKKSKGKGRVKGQHFVRNTLDAENDKLAEIMLGKIIKKMEG